MFWKREKPRQSDHELTNPLLQSLLAMAWFVEARDPYTGGHLWRVSRYAYLLATGMGLTKADCARISLGGFLHDLGKIGIPDAILGKTGALTDQEYAQIKTHSDIGLRLLGGHPLAPLVESAVGSHHERPDGKGYPKGLSGDALSLDPRIVGLCDAFDAMTSQRPYRPGMSEEKALAIIIQEAGHQFDAKLVPVFQSLSHQGVLAHIMGHSDEGIPLQDCPMCGPTLVITRENKVGDNLYCRSCEGEFELIQGNGKLPIPHPTGRMGAPADLEPIADEPLLQRIVNDLAPWLQLDDLLRASHIKET